MNVQNRFSALCQGIGQMWHLCAIPWSIMGETPESDTCVANVWLVTGECQAKWAKKKCPKIGKVWNVMKWQMFDWMVKVMVRFASNTFPDVFMRRCRLWKKCDMRSYVELVTHWGEVSRDSQRVFACLPSAQADDGIHLDREVFLCKRFCIWAGE